MRNDETHPPSHLVIGEALLYAAINDEQRKARRRLVEGSGELIHEALRFSVLLVDTRFHEFGIWHAIFDAVDFPDLEQELAGRHGIDPGIFVKVAWYSRGLEPRIPKQSRGSGLAHGVLRIKR